MGRSIVEQLVAQAPGVRRASRSMLGWLFLLGVLGAAGLAAAGAFMLQALLVCRGAEGPGQAGGGGCASTPSTHALLPHACHSTLSNPPGAPLLLEHQQALLWMQPLTDQPMGCLTVMACAVAQQGLSNRCSRACTAPQPESPTSLPCSAKQGIQHHQRVSRGASPVDGWHPRGSFAAAG